MELKELIDKHKDTTLWSGMATLLALGTSSQLIVQALVAILAPTISWLLLYYVKKLVIKGKDKEENNNL